MNNNLLFGLVVILAVVIAGGFSFECGISPCCSSGEVVSSNQSFSVVRSTAFAASSNGMTALSNASSKGKYLFIFFFKQNDKGTSAMRKNFDAAMNKVKDRANWVAISIDNKDEVEIIKRFDASRSPMPLAIAVAPNGAITGGFPESFTESDLTNAIVSHAMEACLEALQNGNLVFICAQNSNTRYNSAAMKGINDFKADKRYSKVTTIIMVDPTDKAEAKLLKQFNIDPKTGGAVTVFLSPPGNVIDHFNGPTSLDALAAALAASASSGCGPGGCGPGGCG